MGLFHALARVHFMCTVSSCPPALARVHGCACGQVGVITFGSPVCLAFGISCAVAVEGERERFSHPHLQSLLDFHASPLACWGVWCGESTFWFKPNPPQFALRPFTRFSRLHLGTSAAFQALFHRSGLWNFLLADYLRLHDICVVHFSVQLKDFTDLVIALSGVVTTFPHKTGVKRGV